MFGTPKGACGEWTSKHVKQVERQGSKKNMTRGTTCCLTICSEFSLFLRPAVVFYPIYCYLYTTSFLLWFLTWHWLVWFTCWRAHEAWNVLVSWYEDIFWKQMPGGVQGRVFFYHTFQMCSFNRCKETVDCNYMKKKMMGRFLIFHSKLQVRMLPWSNLQSSADPHKQWHPSPLHHSLIFLQKHQARWRPTQMPPFFIIPLGFGDLGALFHYTATIISQRKLKSFNLWKALFPGIAAA